MDCFCTQNPGASPFETSAPVKAFVEQNRAPDGIDMTLSVIMCRAEIVGRLCVAPSLYTIHDRPSTGRAWMPEEHSIR